MRTNIVYFEIAETAEIDAAELTARMWLAGVRGLGTGGRRVRMVVHRTITHDDVLRAAATVGHAIAGALDAHADLPASGLRRRHGQRLRGATRGPHGGAGSAGVVERVTGPGRGVSSSAQGGEPSPAATAGAVRRVR